MKRIGLAVFVALLGATSPAHGAVTVTTTHGTAQAQVVESCKQTGQHRECVSAGPSDLPELLTTPGDTVTIALDDDADTVSAKLVGSLAITPLRLDARTYTFPFPPGELLPRILRATATDDKGYGTTAVMLVPPDMPRLSKLRLQGRRLSVKLSCPGGCTGSLALRFDGLVLARLKFAGVKHKMLTQTVSRATQRRLKRYAALSARLTTEGRAPISTDLELRR